MNGVCDLAELLGVIVPVAIVVIGLIGVYILCKGRFYYADEVGCTVTTVAVVAAIVALVLTCVWAKSSDENLHLFAETAGIGCGIASAIGLFFGIPAVLGDTLG